MTPLLSGEIAPKWSNIDPVSLRLTFLIEWNLLKKGEVEIAVVFFFPESLEVTFYNLDNLTTFSIMIHF